MKLVVDCGQLVFVQRKYIDRHVHFKTQKCIDFTCVKE